VSTLPILMAQADDVVRDATWSPRWGWHDDHRAADRTPAYLPAVQQVRAEFKSLVIEIGAAELLEGKCLQLGMGECNASHAVWGCLFSRVVTIDLRVFAVDQGSWLGGDVRKRSLWSAAAAYAPFDFLFIDAGHRFEDAEADHREYGALVRPGGIVAFHDALKRPTYEEEIQVWRYLETLPNVNMIGDEVGVAWIVKA